MQQSNNHRNRCLIIINNNYLRKFSCLLQVISFLILDIYIYRMYINDKFNFFN